MSIAVIIAVIWFTGLPALFQEWISSEIRDQSPDDQIIAGLSSRISPADTLGFGDYNEAVKLIGVENMASYDFAEQKLKIALQKNPKLAEAHLNLGLIYLNKGWYDGAESETNQSISMLRQAGQTMIEGNTLQQSLAVAYNNLGVIEMGRAIEAENAFDLASAKAHWLKGMGFFQTAISSDPTCSNARANIARYKDVY